MNNEKNNYVIQNGKLVNPDIPDGCIGYWDFTLQKNIDNNRTMTPDLSGHGHHMYHKNMLFGENKFEKLYNSVLHSEVVSKNSKGYHVYKYTPKTRTSDSIVFYDIVSGRTIKDKQTVTVTIYAKYEGNADKLKPSIRIYKYADANGPIVDLSGLKEINESENAVKDSEGYTRIEASYTNNTGADITNVSIVVYCANSNTSYLEDGHKPVTYFYIDSINDGVTSLRSGFFSQSSEGWCSSGGLVYDGIDDVTILPNSVKNLETYTVVKDDYLTSNKSDIAYIKDKKVGRNYRHSNFIFNKNDPVMYNFSIEELDKRTTVYKTTDDNLENNFNAYFFLIYRNSIDQNYTSKEILEKKNIVISLTVEFNININNLRVSATNQATKFINVKANTPIKIEFNPIIDKNGDLLVSLATGKQNEKVVVKVTDCKVEIGDSYTDYIPSAENLLQDIRSGTVKNLQVYNHSNVTEIYNSLKNSRGTL